MSYLSATNPGFTKAIISFWFKIPQESLDAAQAAYTGEGRAILEGIVPLVVMGKEGKGDEPTHTEEKTNVVTQISSGTYCSGGLIDIQVECTSVVGFCCRTSLITFVYVCECVEIGPNEYLGGRTKNTTVTGPAPKTDPTFIGVDGYGTLRINFESTNIPTVSPPDYEISSITPGTVSGGQFGECSGGTSSFGCDVLCCVCLLIECSNDVDNGHGEDNRTPSPPQHAGTSTAPKNHYTQIPGEPATGAIYSDGINVEADVWHHVLISVDLKPVKTHGIGPDGIFSSPVSQYVDSAARLWVALDDKNYIKGDLSSNWVDGTGDNDVISDGGWRVAGSSGARDEDSPSYGEVPSYSLEMSVPSGDIGMPAPARYEDNVRHCEMAEFQMWTGKTLDTASETNRRLFLDYKRDDKNKPIPDDDGKLRMRPVNPKVAEDELGKPNINLHGSGKWKAGENTGTGPKFTPTGIIKTYKPDPAILPAT